MERFREKNAIYRVTFHDCVLDPMLWGIHNGSKAKKDKIPKEQS